MAKNILIGIGVKLGILLLLPILWIVIIGTEIESMREMYINETNQSMEIVVYRAGVDGESKDRTEITLTGQGLRQIKRGRKRGVPECAKINTLGASRIKWINLTGIMTMRNGEWHETPTVREYRITEDLESSEFCENKYAE